MSPKVKRCQPRANNARVFSSDELSEMQSLLCRYEEVPIHCLTLLYKAKFNKILDCISMKIDGGLLGYLERSMGNMIDMRLDINENIYVSLNERRSSPENSAKENIKPLLTKRIFERDIRAFFNPDSILWKGCSKLLDQRNLTIDISFYERAKLARETLVIEETNKISRLFSMYPDGINLINIRNVVSLDPGVFQCTCMETMTQALPQLFYRVDREYGDPIVFNGKTHTYSDLSGHDDQFFDKTSPQIIVEEALKNNLYQQTLILMRDKGVAGLKLELWLRSMYKNFYHDKPTEELCKYSPLTFFMALARFGLVEIRPGKYAKNDLDVFIPKKKSSEVEPIFQRFLRQRSQSCKY